MIVEVFTEFGLSVNQSKTEWVHLRMADVPAERGTEAWTTVRQLGSLLGERPDVPRRIQLASEAYRSLYSLWLRREKVSLPRRVRLYNAFVLPVLLYNSATWGLPDADLSRLSACCTGDSCARWQGSAFRTGSRTWHSMTS